MSKIATYHNNPLQFFIALWVMIHMVLVISVIDWPPPSLGAWIIFGVAGVLALYFDLGLLYFWLTNKTETNSPRVNGDET